jgi:hypothetical protein
MSNVGKIPDIISKICCVTSGTSNLVKREEIRNHYHEYKQLVIAENHRRAWVSFKYQILHEIQIKSFFMFE